MLAREVTGLTLLLRAAPLAEPQRPLSVAPGRARRARPARRRAAVAAAFVVSLGSAFAILSLPSPSGLLVPSSALRFADAQQEIEFAQSKNLTLEPLLDSVASVEVPVFSHRALR